MSIPRLHHYLPQFYLRGFSPDDEDQIWVFDREKSEYRKQGTKTVGAERDYHSFELPSGEKDSSLEISLAKLEGEVKPIIARLECRNPLEPGQKHDLSVFIGLLASRVPAMRQSFGYAAAELLKRTMRFSLADPGRVESVLNELGETAEPKQVHEFFQAGTYDVKISENQTLHWSVKAGLAAARYFSAMDWYVIHAPTKKSFITSDFPLTTMAPREMGKRGGHGFAVPGVLKLFPLTSKTCLMMGDASKDPVLIHLDADRDKTRYANLTTSFQSERFLIAKDRALLESLVDKMGLTLWRPGPRFQVG